MFPSAIKNLNIKISRLILPVVLYGCETWSLTIREEHRLRVFENRVLRRIFGPKRDGVIGGWRKLHNEELHNLFYLPDVVVIRSGRMRYRGLVGKALRGETNWKAVLYWMIILKWMLKNW
jgi:hypothetical protein